MLLLYKLGIFLYKGLIYLLTPVNPKAHKAIFDRKESIRSLKNLIKDEKPSVTWFHSSSLGEFEQGLPVMEAYKKENPQQKILVTFFSASGYDYRKDHPIADYTCYLPWDTARRAKDFVELFELKEVFFIKYEYFR